MLQRILYGAFISLALSGCGGDTAVTRGSKLYAEHCALCHGADLRGGGGAGVEGLSGIPSDLTLLALNAGGAFPRAEVLAILGNYAAGSQTGRIMRPFRHLSSDDSVRVRTSEGRVRTPKAQADLLAFLEARQRP